MKMNLAACAGMDTELFFPLQEKGSGETVEMVKKICSGCEVRQDCLESAIANDNDWGVWGGMTPRERRIYKRNR